MTCRHTCAYNASIKCCKWHLLLTLLGPYSGKNGYEARLLLSICMFIEGVNKLLNAHEIVRNLEVISDS